ncbi:hypothetical protein [Mongoliitalea lutea]|uniref:Uncharacterized protein n=1 Tax=Mongoliitalea lutea TaxID=849756 RepID=A0A8J3D0T2_9BACT|nr:hypothetical protein [Mongoliitalea lutea]GHB44578.1 hypothetical protein GCM10008106_27070 [Mongoliitalea lutea]
MPRFRAFKLQGVRALYENGLRVSISSEYLEIRKTDPFFIQQELKTLTKQYEITEEEFKVQFKTILKDFPEIKEVVNG